MHRKYKTARCQACGDPLPLDREDHLCEECRIMSEVSDEMNEREEGPQWDDGGDDDEVVGELMLDLQKGKGNWRRT
jgi:hypothetical protein